MATLIDVASAEDVLPVYRDSPIERLLRYHNLGEPRPDGMGGAELFIAMCIDNRKALDLPNEFAFVLRTAGARLDGNEFELTYAVAVGGVAAVALIGHTDCGMAHVMAKRDAFVAGLVERGHVEPGAASAHFDAHAPGYAIAGPVEFTLDQAAMVRTHLPGLLVAPLLYRVEDGRLVQIAASE